MARKPTRGNARAPFSASSSGPSTSKSKSKSSSQSQSAPRKRRVDPSNAYTYLPSLPKRHRTSEAQLSLSREEAAAGPSTRGARGPGPRRRDGIEDGGDDDADSDEDMEERIRKLAMMIAEEGPGAVDSEESSIDSDEAWESGGSDEERWGDVFRDLQKGKGKKGKSKAKEVVRKPAKPLTVNLDESGDEEPNKAKKPAKKPQPAVEEDDEDVEDEDEDEDDLEDDEEDGLDDDEGEDEDEDEEDDEDDDILINRSSKSTKSTRSAFPPEEDEQESDGGEDEDEAEEDEQIEDSDSDEDGDSDDVDAEASDLELPSDLSEDEDPQGLDDLDAFVEQLATADRKRKTPGEGSGREKKRRVLPVVPGPALRDGDLALKSNSKIDISTLLASHPSLSGASALLPSKADPTSSSILKQGVLPAPLPTVVQERLDREAAYEKTKEEGAKWSGVMKRIKEAEHLSFPLQASDRGGTKSAGEMIASFKPTNPLESAITSLLKQANLTDQAMKQHEDEALAGQDLSLEEIEARRAQLRQQRELMFRAEAKAKRVAKIKSKTFRKLARKRAEKAGISVEDLERLDPEAAEQEREKQERQRAKERATLRHGAGGKFGRETAGGTTFGLEDRRKAREDMLDMRERLQRKIAGRGDGESDDDDDEEESDEDEDDDDIKAAAFNQLARLDGKDSAGEQQGKKGLMQMKFMQKAQDREMRKVAEEEQALREEIRLFGEEKGEGSGEEEDDEDDEGPQMMKLGEGRMVFSGPAKVSDSAESPAPTATASALGSASAPSAARANSPPALFPQNPWLVPTASSGPSRKNNTVSTSTEARAVRNLKKAAGKASVQDLAAEDERVEIDLDAANLGQPTKGKGRGKGGVQTKKRERGGGHANDGEADEDEDEDEDEGEDELMPTSGVKAFSQRDLVAEAFAGDNVVEDFAAEKARQIEADAPKTEDTSLPGWGSWGGKGLRKRAPNPKFLVKTAGIEPSNRKDFGNSKVIITEKKDRKAAQFLVKDLPYPYTSVAQYEASFNSPVGAEWNSRKVHQKETTPRVVKKPGAIIEPVRRLF